MNNAAALHELNRALAHFRRRQDHTPTPHSAREIAQMSMLAEHLFSEHIADEQYIAERILVNLHRVAA